MGRRGDDRWSCAWGGGVMTGGHVHGGGKGDDRWSCVWGGGAMTGGHVHGEEGR